MGTTVADTPIETGFDHAPRMERLADVGFFGGDVKVGLEKVRMRLLDLSKRNRLLNFKHPKSCLRAIDELPDQIFRKLIEGKGLSINPVSIPNPNRLASEVRERLEQLRGPELLNYVAEQIYGIDTSYELPKPDPDGPAEARHIDNYLQTYQFPEPLEATVSSLSRAAKLAIEETGSNMCYLAFGFLEWFEVEFPDKGCLAPLMLVPISVSKGDVDSETSTYRYQIRYSEEDLMPNLSLIEMLRRNFDIALPPLPEWQEGDGYESVEDYWAKCLASISTQPGWRIHRFVSASLFQFQKLLMYLDLDAAKWPSDKSILAHEKIRALFEGTACPSALSAEEYQIDDLTETTATLEIIEDADSSQMSALIDAHEGKDLVIEGPPGTGKSQTITNLIAASLAAGKSVLFVSEKLAALEVVKQRLSNAGLGDFCLELHSNKINKLALLESLSQRLKLTVSPIQNLVQKLSEMESRKTILRELSKVLDSRDPETGQTVQEILVEAVSLRLYAQNHLRREDFERLAGIEEAVPTYPRLSELHDHFTDLVSLHGELNGDILEHPWRAIGRTRIDKHPTDIVRSLEAASEEGASLFAALTELSSLCGCELIEDFERVKSVVDISAHFESSGIDIWHALVPAASSEKTVLRKFQQDLRNQSADRSMLAKTFRSLEAERISNNESLATAIERLLVDFNGFTLAVVEQVILAIKEVCDLLSASGDLLTIIQTTFTLPSIEEQRWVATIRGTLESIAFAPKDNLTLRSKALANPEALCILQEANMRRVNVEALKAALRKEFHLDLLPQRDELLETKRTLAATGLFSIFSSRWREAYRTHRSLCIVKARKWTSSEACADIDRLLEFQAQVEDFNSDHRYQSELGNHFAGLTTNFEKLISVAQWLADSRSRLATGPPGVPSPTFAKLVEIETSTLLEFTAAAPKLSNDFARISLLRDWIRELTGFEILRRRVTISEWNRELSNLRDELASAVRTILAFEPRPDAPLSEIASALDKAGKIVAETERLDGDTRLASLLGSHFNGSKTDSASLGRVLTFVDGIHDSSLPGEYKAALTSFDSPEAFALIKESLAETLRHHRLLLDQLEELSAACAAEVKDFGPRNASSIQRLLEELDLLSAQAERLGTFIRFKNHTHTCREAGVSHLMDILERDAVLPGVLEKILKWQVMRAKAKGLIESHAILKREGQSLNTVRREYAKLDRECILLQRRVVAHKLVKIPIPQGFNAARVRDKTDLALIKSQIGLHRPSVTVRNLLSRAGGAVMAIKPCFMMGPLSVAQFLARGGLEFDLLVMDEASQMRPEDALGAIARARQVVVVGDSKQLPPTSFFSRTGVGSDEDNPEDATSLEESESILEAAASIFHPSRQLKWHYRSQHESLVAFSNHRFYGGKLVVFPSPSGSSPDYGVKFFKVPGVYAGSKNELEAKEVARAVIDHVKHRKKESIGIVAMNLQQADLIENCIEKLLKTDPIIQKDWDEFEAENEGIFVKNLENVQGDERDVIYISITFGPNEHGVIHKTFGPITSATGWRRLNVLYTRARKRVHVYSSMSGAEIDLLPTASVGSRALKDYLTFAETSRLPTEVESGRAADSPFETDVEAALLERGFECVKQLGVAGFFLDLAIRHPEKRGSYILGVECDGAAYHSSKCARDRDRLRQEVLENMGWYIHRIWSTDWFRDPHHELQVLVKKLETLLRTSSETPGRPEPDAASESADDIGQFVLSISANDWFYAAKWAKQNDFLSSYQRRMLYMTGIGAREKKTYNTAAEAAKAYRELQRLGLSRR